MTLVKVADMPTYIELIKMCGERFSSDVEGNPKPLFGSVSEVADFLWLNVDDWFDDNGEPVIDNGESNQLRDFPDKMWEPVLRKRLEGIDMDFPFHVIVHGDSEYDGAGKRDIVVFFETKEQTVYTIKQKEQDEHL